MLTDSYFSRFQSETSLQVSENSTEVDKKRIYYLDPTVLMDDETTLYGRILFQQTLWYNLIENKLTTKTRFKHEKMLDNRYNNETEKTFKQSWEEMIRLTAFKKTNFELLLENSRQEESVYKSVSTTNSCNLDVRHQLNPDLLLNTSLVYSNETSKKNDYQIDSYEVSETLTYYLQKKYRIFGKLSFKRNDRSGSSFMSFLADKKDGNIFKWNLNVNYRVNSYTSAKLEYSGNSYPGEDEEHKISVEVKAEF
jgi:hypothetical protein